MHKLGLIKERFQALNINYIRRGCETQIINFFLVFVHFNSLNCLQLLEYNYCSEQSKNLISIIWFVYNVFYSIAYKQENIDETYVYTRYKMHCFFKKI